MKQTCHAKPRDEAVERIEHYIAQQNIAPHGKLPSERDLCEAWGINRTTLRSAIQRLTAEGKLYSKKGSGTYVAQPKLERDLQDAKSTTEFILELGYRLKTQVLCMEIMECNKHLSKKLRLPIGSKTFFLRRLRVLQDVPLMVEYSYLNYALCPGIEEYDFCDESFYNVLAHYGVCVQEGDEHVGITYATEEEAALLAVEPGAPVFFITGVSYDANKSPIEYFKSVQRVDKIRFSSTLMR